MFKLNDPIQKDGVAGRVIAVDKLNTLHVLIRTNENAWKVEKWYSLMCQPYMSYLWTIENAFRIPERRYVKSPELKGKYIDDYPYVIRLK